MEPHTQGKAQANRFHKQLLKATAEVATLRHPTTFAQAVHALFESKRKHRYWNLQKRLRKRKMNSRREPLIEKRMELEIENIMMLKSYGSCKKYVMGASQPAKVQKGAKGAGFKRCPPLRLPRMSHTPLVSRRMKFAKKRRLQQAHGRRFLWQDFVDEYLQPREGQTNVVEIGCGNGSFAAGFRSKYLMNRDDVLYVTTSPERFEQAEIECWVDVEVADNQLEDMIGQLKQYLIKHDAPSNTQLQCEEVVVDLLIFNNPVSRVFAVASEPFRQGQNITRTLGRQIAAANRALLIAYFHFASLVGTARVHVMLASINHYYQWDVRGIAKRFGFQRDKFGVFDDDVPGYKPVHVDGSYTGNYMNRAIVCMFKSKPNEVPQRQYLCSPLTEHTLLRAGESLDRALVLKPEAEDLLKEISKSRPPMSNLVANVVHSWQKRHYSTALEFLQEHKQANEDVARAYDLLCTSLTEQRAQVRLNNFMFAPGNKKFNNIEGHLIGYNNANGCFKVSIKNEEVGRVVKSVKAHNLIFLNERSPCIVPPEAPQVDSSSSWHEQFRAWSDAKVLLIMYSRIPGKFYDALFHDPRLTEYPPKKLQSGAKVLVKAEHYEPLMEVLLTRQRSLKSWHVILEPSLEPVMHDIVEEVNKALTNKERFYQKGKKIVPLAFACKAIAMGLEFSYNPFIDIKLPSSLRSIGASVRDTKSTTDADPRKARKQRRAQK